MHNFSVWLYEEYFFLLDSVVHNEDALVFQNSILKGVGVAFETQEFYKNIKKANWFCSNTSKFNFRTEFGLIDPGDFYQF